MSDLVPASGASLLAPLRNGSEGPMLTRIGTFTAQPAVRKVLPWFAGIAGAGLLALTWATLAPAPQRVLYASLDDSERADVVAALDKASIHYQIDNATGALTVDDDELYKARMVVASNGALAAPQSGEQLIDSLPMGASRTLESDRLRAAQERDLMLTIGEIDGVEAVRVHLARPDRSVFVREEAAPTASVMMRMKSGRQLSDSQVAAIANLVAGSVPGLNADAVRIVDQHGRLLSDAKGADSDRLELQTRMEAKLQAQVEQLLAPMVGSDKFTAEVQVDLDMNEVTSARESYDKDGAVRRETTESSQTSASGAAGGVPGVLANTPPPTPQAKPGAPQGSTAPQSSQGTGESSSSRTYELGREVSVSNGAVGDVKRISVAVAIDQTALKGGKAADLQKIQQLVTAAVGANTQRGDTIAVVARPFQPAQIDSAPFWETSWFATILRYAVALIGVILVLFLAVRPVVKALTKRAAAREGGEGEGDAPLPFARRAAPAALAGPHSEGPSRESLSAQIELAQRIVREQPDDALQALRRMLAEAPVTEGAGR